MTINNKRMGYPLAKLSLLLIIVSVLHLNSCTTITPVPEKVPSAPAADLLNEAEQDIEAGNLNRAELQLERAMRMDPRNGQVWHLMARIRYEQGDYDQAVQFCLKSNTLAGDNPILKRQNWMLLEKAYTSLGEMTKAEEARHKAATL
jgi:cytochrome c-type biogenesis protein CcmH/NrfG